MGAMVMPVHAADMYVDEATDLYSFDEGAMCDDDLTTEYRAEVSDEKLQQDFVEQILSGVDEEKRKKMAEILNQMEKNLDEMLKGEH